MKLQLFLLSTLLIIASCGNKKHKVQEKSSADTTEKHPERYVRDNLLISKELPEITIQVADEFEYLGSFYFELKANSENTPAELKGKVHATGNRYVFAKSDESKKVQKLFIVQCEGFLPHIDNSYKYNFSNSEVLGNNQYRHNTWFYDSAQLAKEHPEDEGALTRAFLEDKGYTLEDHLMMSRWVGLASDDRRNEIIIYYLEMLKNTTGYTLDDYEQLETKEANEIRNALITRSRKSFTIVKG